MPANIMKPADRTIRKSHVILEEFFLSNNRIYGNGWRLEIPLTMT
jgi:hypothetical protein